MKKIFTFLLLFSITANSFSQNYKKYRNGYLWGYQDATKKVIIPAKFGYAEDFKDGLAIVAEGSSSPNEIQKLRIINTKGAFITDTIYQKIINIGKGLVVVGISQDYGDFSYGIIDKAGKSFLPNEYSKISAISEGLIVVSKGKQCGVIDLTGKFVIQLQSDFVIFDFKCGVAKTRKNYSWGLIDETGKILIDPQNSGFPDMSDFNKDCVAEVSKNNNYGFINSTGKIIVEPKYSQFELKKLYDGSGRIKQTIK